VVFRLISFGRILLGRRLFTKQMQQRPKAFVRNDQRPINAYHHEHNAARMR